MQASILSIGSELLRGDILDTNATFLARELSQLGFEVRGVQEVGDLLSDLTETIRADLQRCEVTICTGGLGPTQDDLTRQAIAAAVGEEMYTDPELQRQLEERFSAMQRRMPASNLQQATLIPSAQPLPNPRGTAPGWFVQRDGRCIAAMPGPPREMEPMWREQVRPRLEQLLPGYRAMRALMTFGLGESAVEERIRGVINRHPHVTVATYAKPNGVQVHITASAESEAEAGSLAHDTVQELRGLLGRAVYGEGDATLSQAVGELLSERRTTVAAMESATGGEVAALITNTAGSSSYFLGGIVAYTREAKVSHGVSGELLDRFGLISSQAAEAMAQAARSQFGADFGVATTGVAGREAVEGKAPGTVFLAVDGPGGSSVREIHRPGDRETVKQFAAQTALDLLRRVLLDGKGGE